MKAVEYFKQGLMGHIRRNMEDSSAEGNLKCGVTSRFPKRILGNDLEIIIVLFWNKKEKEKRKKCGCYCPCPQMSA